MAKGQMKKNKEAKKPKADKPKGFGFGLQAGPEPGRIDAGPFVKKP